MWRCLTHMFRFCDTRGHVLHCLPHAIWNEGHRGRAGQAIKANQDPSCPIFPLEGTPTRRLTLTAKWALFIRALPITIVLLAALAAAVWGIEQVPAASDYVTSTGNIAATVVALLGAVGTTWVMSRWLLSVVWRQERVERIVAEHGGYLDAPAAPAEGEALLTGQPLLSSLPQV